MGWIPSGDGSSVAANWFLGNGTDLGVFLNIHILPSFGDCGDKVISPGMKTKELLESRVKETINETMLEHPVIFLGLGISSGPSLTENGSETLLKNFYCLGFLLLFRIKSSFSMLRLIYMAKPM